MKWRVVLWPPGPMNKTLGYEPGDRGLNPLGATIPASSNGQDASLLNSKSRFDSLGGDHLDYAMFVTIGLPTRILYDYYSKSDIRLLWLEYTLFIDVWLHDVMENMSRS